MTIGWITDVNKSKKKQNRCSHLFNNTLCCIHLNISKLKAQTKLHFIFHELQFVDDVPMSWQIATTKQNTKFCSLNLEML